MSKISAAGGRAGEHNAFPADRAAMRRRRRRREVCQTYATVIKLVTGGNICGKHPVWCISAF